MSKDLVTFSNNYLEILTTELAGLNLTRIESPEEFYHKQILDSVIPYRESKSFKNYLDKYKKHLDIGFGGGFPILPLSYEHDGLASLGIEARKKKAEAVQLIADKLGLQTVKTMHLRIEDMVIDTRIVITLKAVGKVEDFLSKLNFTKEIVVFFYKGPKFYELENIEPILKDWEIVEEYYYDVEGTEGRLLIGFKPKKVPRGTKIKNKKLVEVSQFI